MAIGIVWSKVVSLSTMFAATMVCGVAVYFIVRFFKRRGRNTANLGESVIVRLLNCFAGGLFLGTFLLHLLPDVREVFGDILKRYNNNTEFPVAEATTAVGFFLVMLLEEIIEICQQKASQGQVTGHHNHGADLPGLTQTTFGTFNYAPTINRNSKSFDDSLGSHSKVPSTVEGTVDSSNKINSRNGTEDSNRPPDAGAEGYSFDHRQSSDIGIPGSVTESQAGIAAYDKTTDTIGKTRKTSLRAFILVLALSLHTVFEGLALGLQDTESKVWELFAAVTVHKTVMAMAIAIELSKGDNNTFKRICLSLFVFAIMSPIGIGIAIAISETSGHNQLATDTASGILQGLATGTFLYVTFFEILNREMESSPDIRKVAGVIFGFSAIIGLQFLGD